MFNRNTIMVVAKPIPAIERCRAPQVRGDLWWSMEIKRLASTYKLGIPLGFVPLIHISKISRSSHYCLSMIRPMEAKTMYSTKRSYYQRVTSHYRYLIIIQIVICKNQRLRNIAYISIKTWYNIDASYYEKKDGNGKNLSILEIWIISYLGGGGRWTRPRCRRPTWTGRGPLPGRRRECRPGWRR